MGDTTKWLPVVDMEGLYEVSDDGRVRSLPRQLRVRGNGIRTLPGRELSPYKMKKLGHIAIDLSPRSDTPGVKLKRRRTRVHILMLEAFVGPRPPGYEGCHNDGDVENNRLGNLRWDTSSANNYDMVRHGTHHYAKRSECEFGHPLDGIAKHSDGSFRQRYCKTCNNDRNREEKAKRKGFASHAERQAAAEAKIQDRIEFGQQLAAAMTDAGVNQVQAAALFGTSQANVWRWMNGRCAPSPARREELLRLLEGSAA